VRACLGPPLQQCRLQHQRLDKPQGVSGTLPVAIFCRLVHEAKGLDKGKQTALGSLGVEVELDR
jgi:hypothetical protein